VLDTSDPATRHQAAHDVLLPLRVELVGAIADAMRHLLAAASTPGELGMIATWENRTFTVLLDGTAAQLAGLLGTDLPPAPQPSPRYSGPPRVIVPTVRGAAFERESLEVRVLVLAESPPESGTVYWRRLGGPLHSVPLRHVDRGVYVATLPSRAARGLGFEYYVEVRFGG